MPIARIRNILSGLRQCNSGNATLMMALGMPVLIGGAGLGVDLSQWYLWKRELQFAVDQAAIAGAWARTDSDTSGSYVTRARQEFTANLAITEGITTTPAVALANYASGSLNSVTVHATASKSLPFSSFLTGEAATISAYAQATFQEGQTFTSCLIAIDEDDMGAFTISGTSVLTAGCGIAALSTDDLAIRVNGNPTIEAGWIIAAGGIDQWLVDNTDDVVIPYMEGLFDPYADLTPPAPTESEIDRTYSCAAQAPSTVADVSTRVVITYTYFQGANANTTTTWANPDPKDTDDDTTTEYGKLVAAGTVAGTDPSGTPEVTTTRIGGSGNSKKYERATRVTTVSRANVVVTPGTQAGDVQPGTYEDIHISCDTTFAPGVYHIVGGGLKITGQYEVNGSGVMFVLHDGGWVDIAGGADITLTAMLTADLVAKGIDTATANDLSGMLIFEDRTSEGSNKTKINGNSATTLNGTLYFPVSSIEFAGTAQVTSQCLMIAADNIVLTGTTNMTTFCPSGSSEDDVVASTLGEVRLVG